MTFKRPVTAAQIRAQPEWQAPYPGAEVLDEQDADEGQGTGFDNLNMNASAWTYYHAPAATWHRATAEQIVDEYASRLTTLGLRPTTSGRLPDGSSPGSTSPRRYAACRVHHVTQSRPRAGSGTPGDYYTTPDEIVAKAREVGAVALRLDVRDLSFLQDLPAIRYLHLRSDGSPILDPVGALPGLRALIIENRAQRGNLDVGELKRLRWLRVGLGGKGGAAMLPAISAGLPNLEWLAVSETKTRTAAELVGRFPALRALSIGFADFLRELGPLATASPNLTTLSLNLTGIRTLAGMGDLAGLRTLNIFAGKADDLGPLRALDGLRYARLLLPRVRSIEPLRGHPSLRMLELAMAAEPERSVLDSIPGLVAIGRGKSFTQAVPWPDLATLPEADPLRVEWRRAMRE